MRSPALFAIVVLPYAFSTSVTSLLMPYLLRKHGATVDEIATIVVIAHLPTIWSFLWSPLADVGLRRRSWAVLASLSAGAAGAMAILSIDRSQALLTTLLFAMNAFAGLLSSTCGALLSALPGELRGRAAGWYQGGNTGGAALGGAAAIWLADRVTLPVLALAIVAAMSLPAMAVLRLQEPVRATHAASERLGALARDLKSLLRSRQVWIGLVFLLSPVGSAAIGNLIAGMGPDYDAGGTIVLWVTGIGGGLFAASGSLLGGFVADKIGRYFAYPLAGAMACLWAAFLGFNAATPFNYALGYSGYSIAAGFAFAVYTAIVLDILGRREHAAASGYAILNSAGNLPIAYMTWLDGWAYRQWGARGTMLADASANGLFAIVLLLVAILLRRQRRFESQE